MPNLKKGTPSTKASQKRCDSSKLQNWISSLKRQMDTNPQNAGMSRTILPGLVQFGGTLYHIILQQALVVEGPFDTETSCGSDKLLEEFDSFTNEGVQGVKLREFPLPKQSRSPGVSANGPREGNPLSLCGHSGGNPADPLRESHKTGHGSQGGPATPIKGETHTEAYGMYDWEITCNDRQHRNCNESALRKWREVAMEAGNATHADDAGVCPSFAKNGGNLDIQSSADDEMPGPFPEEVNDTQPFHLSCGAIAFREWCESMKVVRKIREGKCWQEVEGGTRSEEKSQALDEEDEARGS